MLRHQSRKRSLFSGVHGNGSADGRGGTGVGADEGFIVGTPSYLREGVEFFENWLKRRG